MIEAFTLPRVFETEEVATLLLALTPRQRRVLREYVERVELGALPITSWFTHEQCPVTERSWYKTGDRCQYRNCAAFQTALEAYLRAAVKAGVAEEAKAIAMAKRRIRLAAGRAAERITDQVDGDMGTFFREVQRWTTDPAPTQEIMETREGIDKDGNPIKEFRVRQTVLDVERLRDPRFSRLVRKFEDTPKGLKIELYDALRAAETILDRADMETASKGEVEVSDARERLAKLLGATDGRNDEDAAGESEAGSPGGPE